MKMVDVSILIKIGEETTMKEVFPEWDELPDAVREAVCKHGAYMRELIEKVPGVDLVRCSQCDWYKTDSERCGFWPDEGYRHPNHYCGEGRPRADG